MQYNLQNKKGEWSVIGSCLICVFVRDETKVDAGRVVGPRHEGQVARLVVEREVADVNTAHGHQDDRSVPRDKTIWRDDNVTFEFAYEVVVNTAWCKIISECSYEKKFAD